MSQRGPGTVRLAGPYHAYLQLRDRETLVADEAGRKDLWRTLGRPGAVLVDGEVAGTWRPRAPGNTLALALEPWASYAAQLEAAVTDQAERYAAFRGLTLTGVTAAQPSRQCCRRAARRRASCCSRR